MQIHQEIDWLSCTMAADDIAQVIPQGMTLGIPEKYTTPNFNLTHRLLPAGHIARKYRAGKQDLFMLDFRGNDIQTIKAGYGTIALSDIIAHVVDNGMNTTRIDFAVDIMGADIHPRYYFRQWRKKRAKTRTTWVKEEILNGGDKGYTVYFGAPTSDRRLRIYDKAAQLKLLEQAWLRVELQTRKPLANPLVSAMHTQGIVTTGTQAIKNFVDFPEDELYTQAISDTGATIDSVPAKLPRWQGWLEEQVLPSIEAHAKDPNDLEFLQEWVLKVRQIIKTEYQALHADDKIE